VDRIGIGVVAGSEVREVVLGAPQRGLQDDEICGSVRALLLELCLLELDGRDVRRVRGERLSLRVEAGGQHVHVVRERRGVVNEGGLRSTVPGGGAGGSRGRMEQLRGVAEVVGLRPADVGERRDSAGVAATRVVVCPAHRSPAA
jgi:hypothetical protein